MLPKIIHRLKDKITKRRFVLVLCAGVVLLLLGGITLWVVQHAAPQTDGQAPQPNTSIRYNKVTDICSYVDLAPLHDLAGEVTSSEPHDYGGGNITCEMRLQALTQPDGQLMVGDYRVEATADFSPTETDKDIAIHHMSWRTFRKDGDRDSTASSEVSTFADIDGLFDDAYSVTRNFSNEEGGLLAYMEHAVSANASVSIKLSGTLRGKVTGDEYKPYVRKMLEGTLKKLQK